MPNFSFDVIEIAQKIGEFFLRKNEFDYSAAENEIWKLRINNISFDYMHTSITIETSRPGMLIGRRGEQIEQLSKFLGVKVKITETRQHILDYLVPCDFSDEMLDLPSS